MIKAIALDDEPLALKIIESFCSRIDYIQLEQTFSKTQEANYYLSKFPIDLIFLDIQMPMQNGMEFFRSIEQHVMVIFTTAFGEYAVEGFNINATDYLLKPFSFDRFLQATDKAKGIFEVRNQVKSNNDRYLFIRADYTLNKILLSDILFIEGLDDYLKIHVANQKTIVARMTLKALMEKLPASDFFRVHRSFIVPIARIDKVRSKIIYLGEEEIPLGANFEAALLQRITDK